MRRGARRAARHRRSERSRRNGWEEDCAVLHPVQDTWLLRAAVQFSDLARPRRSCPALHALHPAGELARRHQHCAARHRRLVAARQCVDASVRAAFPPWDASHGAPDGIVVLGGAITRRLCRLRAAPSRSMNRPSGSPSRSNSRAATRTRASSSPAATTFIAERGVEAAIAVKEFEALGIPHERITAEEQSRNTVENAVFSQLLAHPQPGERWLLVTSAYHMPRAIAAFRAAGFPVEAYPVDWRTRGPIDARRTVCLAWRRLAPHRHGGSRVDRPFGLPDHWQDRGTCSRRLDSRALTVPENSRLILGLFTNPSSRAPMLARAEDRIESGEKCCVTSRRDVLGGLDKHVYGYSCRARTRVRRN